MIEIRLATAEDVPFLPAIESAACSLFDQIPVTASLPLYLTPLADFEEAQRHGLLWVAEAAPGDLAGFALAERVDGALHLEELDVLPAFGRQGIGARLVRAVCDRARVQEIAAVTLCTFRDVPWNAPFYQRLGFRILAEDELTPGLAEKVLEEELKGLPRELRVVMRLELPEAAGQGAPEGGRARVVLEYFRQCAVFWKEERGQLRRWSEQVEDGKIPDFGANLYF